RKRFAGDNATAEAVDQQVTELEARLAGADFTGLAVRTLQEAVFDRARSAIDDKFGTQPLLQARLLEAIAVSQQELGLLDVAVPLQRRAYDLRLQELGPDDERTLTSMQSLGDLLVNAGDHAASEALLVDGVERARRLLPPTDELRFLMLSALSNLRGYQDRLPEAIGLAREALDAAGAGLGGDERQTLAARP